VYLTVDGKDVVQDCLDMAMQDEYCFGKLELEYLIWQRGLKKSLVL